MATPTAISSVKPASEEVEISWNESLSTTCVPLPLTHPPMFGRVTLFAPVAGPCQWDLEELKSPSEVRVAFMKLTRNWPACNVV